MTFRIQLEQIPAVSENMIEIQNQLEQCQNEVLIVHNALDWEIKSKAQIVENLKNAVKRIDDQAAKAGNLKTSLETIISLYREAEQHILDEAGSESNQQAAQQAAKQDIISKINDYFNSLDPNNIDWNLVRNALFLFFPGGIGWLSFKYYIDYRIAKYQQELAAMDPWVQIIKDGKTRKLLHETLPYTDELKETYENADGTAKELYDKYKEQIKIRGTDSDASYHVNGKIYLNYQQDASDPRGASTIYYHESGHFIVGKEKWVSGNKISPEFQAFDQAVKEDVANYITQIEQQYRQELASQYTGGELEEKVKELTESYLERELGDVNFYTLNGVSDMISAYEDGKYTITYRHNPGYWSEAPTRQANEAFAQMFAADFCGDIVETEYMKQYFPNAYQEYEKLKEAALNN